MPGNSWGTDTEISLPEPPRPHMPAVVDLGGFAFTAGGISHNVTQAELEELATPTFAPAR
jgi:hypothetical protein